MQEFKRLFLLVIPMSFVLGLWWGFKIMHQNKNRAENTLKMLSYKGLITEDLKLKLEKNNNLTLLLTEVESSDEWEEAFEKSGPFDLLAPMSYQVEALIGRNRLRSIPRLAELKRKAIAADFLRLAYDRDDNKTLPLFWGINGIVIYENESTAPQIPMQPFSDTPQALNRSSLNEFLTAKSPLFVLSNGLIGLLPKSGAFKFQFHYSEIPMWLQTIAIDVRTEKTEASERFLLSFFNGEIIDDLTKVHSQASPFLVSENLKVESQLRPSYLRRVPVQKVKLQQLSPRKNLPLRWDQSDLTQKEKSEVTTGEDQPQSH